MIELIFNTHNSRLLLSRDLPPPVHGMPTINKAFVKEVNSRQIGFDLYMSYRERKNINGACSSFKKLFHTSMSLVKLIAFLKNNRYVAVYRPIDAVYGLIYAHHIVRGKASEQMQKELTNVVISTIDSGTSRLENKKR